MKDTQIDDENEAKEPTPEVKEPTPEVKEPTQAKALVMWTCAPRSVKLV